MTPSFSNARLTLLLLLLGVWQLAFANAYDAKLPEELHSSPKLCDYAPCAEVFPGAKTFSERKGNPPYVEADAKLDADVVEFEPHLALFSGGEGLDAIRILLSTANTALEPGGSFIFEFGRGQAEAICEIARAHGYADSVIHRDADGLERVFEGVLR